MDKQGIGLSVVPVGVGSLNIMFDLYLDGESDLETAFSAVKFREVISKAIADSAMTLRKTFVDAWETEREGPASLFFSLEESHVRIETWPTERHVQGEVQLCNFSKNNEQAARVLAERIIRALNPAGEQVVIISRGPGRDIRPIETSTKRHR